MCKKAKRMSAVDYATHKCREFSKILPVLERNGTGIQAPFEEGKVLTA